MRGLINLCFKDDKKQFIVLTKFDATCTVDENKFQIAFESLGKSNPQ